MNGSSTPSVALTSAPATITAWICIGGMVWIGLFPNTLLNFANAAAAVLKI